MAIYTIDQILKNTGASPNEIKRLGVATEPNGQSSNVGGFAMGVLGGKTSFPASVSGGASDVPANVAKTFGNIPSSAVKLASPVNPFDIESPVNIGANIAKSGSALKDIYADQSPIEGTRNILKGFADTYLKIGESIYGGLDKAYNALLDDPKKAIADVTQQIAKIGIEDPMLIPTIIYGGGQLRGGKDAISNVASNVTRGADTSLSNMASKTVAPVVEGIADMGSKFASAVKPSSASIMNRVARLNLTH
jgi:hypothetical protein